MGGGLMQLVAYGAQDVYLTGNPQITFFKVVYRRHTNFAVEAILQTVNGSGAQRTVTVARNGDLLGQVYLVSECATVGITEVNVVNFESLANVVVEIGGQKIDEQSGAWMKHYTGLSHGVDKKDMLDDMVAANASGERNYVPLQFWFCRNTGLALPLIALQYHEVKLQVHLQDHASWNHDADDGTTAVVTNKGASANMEVWCDYIYLDTDERRRFAQTSHEYLIEQVQHRSFAAATSFSELLTFNHPVKELVWSLSGSGAKFDGNGSLVLNGHDRFAKRPSDYFKLVQRYEHHSGKHGSDLVYCYSFALKPEEHQPSGTCNFSRIDNAELRLTDTTGALDVYAINYNVLRIMSGMGGLAYSN